MTPCMVGECHQRTGYIGLQGIIDRVCPLAAANTGRPVVPDSSGVVAALDEEDLMAFGKKIFGGGQASCSGTDDSNFEGYGGRHGWSMHDGLVSWVDSCDEVGVVGFVPMCGGLD